MNARNWKLFLKKSLKFGPTFVTRTQNDWVPWINRDLKQRNTYGLNLQIQRNQDTGFCADLCNPL